MKFLSVLACLAVAVSAGSASRQTRPLRSRYELSLSAYATPPLSLPASSIRESQLTPASPYDAPYNDGALSLRDNKAGFWPSQSDTLVVTVEGDGAQGARLSVDSEGDEFLALEGDSGLRDLVLVEGDEAEDAAGFAIEPRDDGDGEGLFNVTWCGGEGGWAVVNVGNDDYELKWRDGKSYTLPESCVVINGLAGEGFTIGTVFPAQVVGRLIMQT